MEILENVDIKDYCTLKIGGKFRFFSVLVNEGQIREACEFAKNNNVPIFLIGGGSNIVFTDEVLNVYALKMEIKSLELVNETDHFADIRVGAGMNWDEFVARACELSLSGVEALSAIPGTVGATPVQNVGAYGAEVKDTIVTVDVFDKETLEIKTLSNADCKFKYRDSIFKNEARGKYIIISVVFRLSKNLPKIPNYHDVKKYFLENSINNPTLSEIRGAIIHIRQLKLPDPKKIFNVGSFFKNPIVDKATAKHIIAKYPDIKTFPAENDMVKIPAGWLIEKAGLKGKNFGTLSVYDHNALVLVNNGGASYADAVFVRDSIIKTVFDKFGITLEQEPEIIK